MLSGVLIGNFNITESIFLIFFSLYNLIANPLRLNLQKLKPVLFGLIIGTIPMFLAPGFNERVLRVSDSLDTNNKPIYLDFFVNLFYFLSDYLSHPFVYLFLLLGIVHKATFLTARFERLLIFFASSQLILLVCLSAGSSFAYPAWHQSIGLYIVAPLLSFSFGSFISRKIVLRNYAQYFIKIVTSLLLFLGIGFLFYSIILFLDRASDFDNSFARNYCLVKANDGPFMLEASEISYSIFGFGFQDINDQVWMEEAYKTWIRNSDFSNLVKCNSMP